VQQRRQQGYQAAAQTKRRWGTARCDCGCGRLFNTSSLRWLTRTKRISLECRLEREKEARRMRAKKQTQGAT
jgi:hypothetical protein